MMCVWPLLKNILGLLSKDSLVIFSSVLTILVFGFFIFPLSKPKDNTFSTWCQEVLEKNGLEGPPIIIREGSRNVIKSIDGIKHIYLKKQSNEEDAKKVLISLIAFSTSDNMKNYQYFTNLDVMLCQLDKENEIL